MYAPPCSKPVLVVEDHPDVLAAIHAALEGEGYPAVCAPSAGTALSVLGKMDRPGLILLDEQLAATTRERFLEHVRQEPTLRSVPVVLLSVQSGHSGLQVQAVLRKPFSLDKLLATAEAHRQE